MAENCRWNFENKIFVFPMAESCHSIPSCFALTHVCTGLVASIAWKMAGYFRNDSWKNDMFLKGEMLKYIKQGLQREEILDFLTRDFWPWSLCTLDKHLRYFDIYYHDTNVSVDKVKEAVKKELHGPGKLLGYRAMYHKVRQDHELNVHVI